VDSFADADKAEKMELLGRRMPWGIMGQAWGLDLVKGFLVYRPPFSCYYKRRFFWFPICQFHEEGELIRDAFMLWVDGKTKEEIKKKMGERYAFFEELVCNFHTDLLIKERDGVPDTSSYRMLEKFFKFFLGCSLIGKGIGVDENDE
jgi:hypothetical protein